MWWNYESLHGEVFMNGSWILISLWLHIPESLWINVNMNGIMINNFYELILLVKYWTGSCGNYPEKFGMALSML